MNILADICRAVANMKIEFGQGPNILFADSGITIQIPRGSQSESEPGSDPLQALTLDSVEDNYLICHDSFNNTVYVAKPDELRNIASETIDGITISYSSWLNATQTRVASWTENGEAKTETQVVQPRYKVGGTIRADSADSTGVTVGGVALTLIEQSGREWARVYADKIVGGTANLVTNNSSGTVSGLVLSGAPKQIFLQVRNALILACLNGDPSYAGGQYSFDFELSAKAPAGAQLDYLIIL